MLRSVFRSAPRSFARLATTSTRPAFTSPIKSRILSQAPKATTAFFSTTPSRFDQPSQELAAKLESEIDIEAQESSTQAGSDSNVESFIAENPFWEIQDRAGEQDVYLTRKYDDETITVHFSISEFNSPSEEWDEGIDPAMADEEDMELQSGGANTKGAVNRGGTANQNFKVAPEDSIAPADREELRDEEDDQPTNPAFPVRVSVLVQRTGKGSLKFILTASEGDIMIEHLIQLPQSLSSNAAELLRNHPENLYTGPPFQQLDEDVQQILEQYLSDRGITTALATFVPDYIDVKEQKEYLGWLRRVKEFVE
ncbi:hypothetical protein PRZ48_011644 [Zasmidium cellare]|uniref:Uncharacterized protein n=1 Tax=Zasmidium cellare TaxID=395010 RepID=A0ABR0E6Y3_ZASCE|nr:hypothetical protein PRZ48_011644 [Zasmidium cellare]